MAFDTLYAEGQRRYVESLSAYARQFLEQMEKPEVESIEGLSPAISIEQKSTSRNPRSTVGTVTEIYDYLRLLFARIGEPHCHRCGKPIRSQSIQQIVDTILELPAGARIQILAPIVRGRKGTYRKEFREAARLGFVRARVDGEVRDLSDEIELDKNRKHDIEIVVDRLVIKDDLKGRLTDSVETAMEAATGLVIVHAAGRGDLMFSRHLACTACGVSVPEMEPRLFSFNSPYGACPRCDGLGVSKSFSKERILLDPAVSLPDGALAWGYDNWSRVLENSLFQAYGVDADTPYRKLPKRFLKVLWEGAGSREFDFRWQGKRSAYHWKGKWEGVVPSLERRYRSTESQTKREALEKLMAIRPCEACLGTRLKPEAVAVTVGGKNISGHTALSVEAAVKLYRGLKFGKQDKVVAAPVMKEILERLGFLANVGLGYLTLDRSAASLSGGEGQRIRLATQIGSRLTGVLYILDEPSIGLHQRDNRKLLDTLLAMRDLGNTVVVVEHDEETIRAADYVVDLGPGAGELGGEVVCAGTPKKIEACRKSLTGAFLSGRETILTPDHRRKGNGKVIEVLGAAENNLKELDIRFPLGMFTCVTGVSGSGKSTLVNQILHRALARALHGAEPLPGKHRELRGVEQIDKVIDIDQSPIGRTPRSNPATYVGLFASDPGTVRKGARGPDAGLQAGAVLVQRPGRPVRGVRGRRGSEDRDAFPARRLRNLRCMRRETLQPRDPGDPVQGQNIAEVLEMTVHQGLQFFDVVPQIRTRLATLQDVGLGYLRLGQPATTLSGGEAQRVKLSKELSRRATGKTFYLLDEPTTGLHFEDIRKLLAVLNRLVDQGNSLVVIEHNLDVIKTADWVIDLGPEGGTGVARLSRRVRRRRWPGCVSREPVNC